MNALAFVVVGLLVGTLSGMIGIGGGIAIIPILIYGFGFSQKMAQGTTLAMLVPPIGIFAAWTYYKSGFVDLRAAALLCAGFVLGGFAGARWALGLPQDVLRRGFGVVLLIVAVRMIVGK